MQWSCEVCEYVGNVWLQVHSWITLNGQLPMPSEEQNCQVLVTVTGDDVTNSVKVIPRLETLVSLPQRCCYSNVLKLMSFLETYSSE